MVIQNRGTKIQDVFLISNLVGQLSSVGNLLFRHEAGFWALLRKMFAVLLSKQWPTQYSGSIMRQNHA